ncbi:MAG: phosphohistidine phosphatase SixA [Gammaproteobacteria bacterium]|nr:phosphohistidine phosphatase SixA [Gammaproteobacteria bacterium]
MKLYLMRHGEALSPDKDPERGLSDNGKLRIEKLARQLDKNGVSFSQVFHSTKKRARETAEIMTSIISPDATTAIHRHIAPNDEPHSVITEINDWNEDTLITSHLPFVPNLMTALTGEDAFLSNISFETGTIICLERNEHATWVLSWSMSPSSLGEI